MANPKDKLHSKFLDSHRFMNFGNALLRMDVRGFRLHKNTSIEFRSPITAFCGHNGTGKTTLLQIAACAYQQKEDEPDRVYQLSDFFAVGPLDPMPFETNAQVGLTLCKEHGKTQTRTLARRGSRWSGYDTRAERPVLFLGAAEFLPRVERKDFAFRNAGRLTVQSQNPCSTDVAAAVAQILSLHYDQINRMNISHKERKDSLLSSTRSGICYSEIHMGFGESRIHNLVERLETQKNNSLLLLEEPEISLHQAAQYRLGEYLVDLALRKGHQILLSTHSEHLMRALPQASRILLTRDGSGHIQVLPGLASSQAASILTDGHDKALVVVVEDDVARCVLAELLSEIQPHLCSVTHVIIGGYRDDRGQTIAGGKGAISAAMKTLRDSGLRVAAVLDADAGDDPASFVYKLPGSKPPEKEIFTSKDVRTHWQTQYQLDVTDFLAGLKNVDHHEWFERLAHRVGRTRDFLVGEAARVYAKEVAGVARPLITQLGEAATRK